MTTTVMSVLLMIGMFITGGAVIYILMEPHENAMREFAVLGLFCAILMMISYYAELNIQELPAKIDAVKFGYIGRVFVNPMLLMLVVRYYGAKVHPLVQILLYVLPILTLYAVFTTEQNRLYYAAVGLTQDGLLSITPGPFYYTYMGYNTALALVYIAFCLYQRAGLRRRARTNNTLLILACLIPFLSLLIYLAGWTGGYDISSLGVMIGSLIIAFSIFRFGLLNKDEMLRSMATGLVFLDSEDRLIYANPAALRIMPALGNRRLMQESELSPLLTPEFATVQTGGKSYQRKITAWSSAEGQHGKLLTFDDVTEIRARLNRDAMTGLLNHATFYPMLDEAMEDSVRSGTSLSVSIADIDSFKIINDTYGHSNGDIILIALADILRTECAGIGDVFRYGGEEFAVIFRCGSEQAEETMRECLRIFSAARFEFFTGHVTFSFGTAEYTGAENSVSLFDCADQRMYTRKRALHQREAEALAAATQSG